MAGGGENQRDSLSIAPNGYGVSVVGHAPEVKERFHAISVERRLKNPAVLAISEAAREELFPRA